MPDDTTLDLIAHIDRRMGELKDDLREDRQERSAQHASLARRVAAVEAKLDRLKASPSAEKRGLSTGAVTTIATVVSTVVTTTIQAITKATTGGPP